MSDSETAKDFVTYDFGAVSHVPKEHAKTIELVHENFATSAAMSIATQLNTESTLSVESVEQQSFQECIQNFSSPTCCALLEMLPLNGYAVLNVSPEVVFSYVDKKLGGFGESPEAGRPLSSGRRGLPRRQ